MNLHVRSEISYLNLTSEHENLTNKMYLHVVVHSQNMVVGIELCVIPSVNK